MQGRFFHDAPTVQTPATPLSAPNTQLPISSRLSASASRIGANSRSSSVGRR